MRVIEELGERGRERERESREVPSFFACRSSHCKSQQPERLWWSIYIWSTEDDEDDDVDE
jgi:hypothetical protein